MDAVDITKRLVQKYTLQYRRIDDEVMKIQDEIERLRGEINSSLGELKGRREFWLHCKKFIECLRKWIDMKSRGEFDVNQMHEKLQTKNVEDKKIYETFGNHVDRYQKEQKQEIRYITRETFIEETLDETAKNEMKLRCIRAMIEVNE